MERTKCYVKIIDPRHRFFDYKGTLATQRDIDFLNREHKNADWEYEFWAHVPKPDNPSVYQTTTLYRHQFELII